MNTKLATSLAVAAGLMVFLAACGGSTQPQPEDGRSGDMMVIRVIVDVKAESVDAFVAHLEEEARQVRQMDGCLRYELFRDQQMQSRFLLYEEWATPAAFEAYQGSELLQQSFAILGPMMAGPPDSEYFEATPRPH